VKSAQRWRGVSVLAILAVLVAAATAVAAPSPPPGRTLAPDTTFYTPPANQGAEAQELQLRKAHDNANAKLIAAMTDVPSAVWLTQGTPAEVTKQVQDVIKKSTGHHAVPVLVAYNIPGRDCGLYSAGGAQTTEAYAAWIDGVAQGIGNAKVVVILEPDGLASMDCLSPEHAADRLAQFNAAVDRLEQQPNAAVYLDAGNSHWQAVGTIAKRLVDAGVGRSQGFFLNVSNYNPTDAETHYGTWVSECIAFGQDTEEGGWRLGHYDWCASQYYSPNGPVNPDDTSTWHFTDEWYAGNMGTAVPTTHFVVDTSRNGQGVWTPTASYPDAQTWCNPPGRGAGLRPTATTGVPLVDAYLWVKIPGESDGQCTRGTAGPNDPAWGFTDPPAGTWFPEAALQLAQNANPPLTP
jgi:endoglucanase